MWEDVGKCRDAKHTGKEVSLVCVCVCVSERERLVGVVGDAVERECSDGGVGEGNEM